MHADVLLGRAMVAAGWIGQACFFARFFVQWVASERARVSILPRSFWWLSLGGAMLMSVYAVAQGTRLLLFGFLVSAAIAARNLMIAPGRRGPGARTAALFGVLVVAISLSIELAGARTRADSVPWLLMAAIGQTLWVARFPLQWWVSERSGHSHLPAAFWWMSLAGNVLLLAYSLHLRDLVFVLGYLPGPFLQARNLALMRREASPA